MKVECEKRTRGLDMKDGGLDVMVDLYDVRRFTQFILRNRTGIFFQFKRHKSHITLTD